MEPARKLKEKLDRGDTVAGMLMVDHLWPLVVDVAINAGLDYIIICLEHGAYDPQTVTHVCTLGRHTGLAVFIRPAANDFRTLSRTIDMGPCGMLLAAIEGTQELDVVRDAIQMPPRGRRRPGGLGNRWVSDFNYATWKRQVEADFIIVPQIETRKGLENVAAIASHEIVTAMGIGPYDLSMALGADLNPEHRQFAQALQDIRQASEAAGKTVWRIGPDLSDLAAQGFNFLCLGDPMYLLTEAIRQKLTPTRG